MSQELQDEAKPEKGQVDQGIQKGSWQGDDYREFHCHNDCESGNAKK